MQVCPLCGTDEFVTKARDPADLTIYICNRIRKHADEPYAWTVSEAGKDVRYPQEGLAFDLDLFTDLRECFDDEGVWIEYGVLEDRFRLRHPDKYQALREIYGSVLLDGPRRYSVASYLTRHVLSALERTGEIGYRYGPATGEWAYTGSISYWAVDPPSSNVPVLTYAVYSESG